MAANNEVMTVSLTSLGDWVLSPVILTWFISQLWRPCLLWRWCLFRANVPNSFPSVKTSSIYQQIKWNLTVIIKLAAESSRKKLVSVSLASRSVGSCGKVEVLAPSNIIKFFKLSRDFNFKLVSFEKLYETRIPPSPACPHFSPPCVGVFDRGAKQHRGMFLESLECISCFTGITHHLSCLQRLKTRLYSR